MINPENRIVYARLPGVSAAETSVSHDSPSDPLNQVASVDGNITILDAKIAGITPDDELRHRIDLTHALQMEALVEVHTDDEVDQAILAGAKIIGINNRNLREFTTDLAVTEELCKLVPDEVLVISESGVHSRHDVQRAVNAGVNGILVGESIVTATDPIAQIKSLIAAGE